MYRETYRPPTRFSVFPPVIKNLLILNALVFMAQLGPMGQFLQDWFALWPLGTLSHRQTLFGLEPVPDFWPWQLITYSFLHGGFTHLFFNMFALWMFGVQIENTWGSRRFAIFYFVCVVGAAVCQMIVSWGVPVATVGASGGVFGILLAFGMMFPEQPIYLYFVLPIKAKWFVIGYGLIELFAGISGAQSGVAHFAHLGGMIFGFLLIQYWRGKLPIQPKTRAYP